MPPPPQAVRIFQLSAMMGITLLMVVLITSIALALTVIIGTLRLQAKLLVGFYQQASTRG